MKITKGKILHLGQSTPGYTFKLGNERLKSSPTERVLGVWVGDKLNMSQHNQNGVLGASNTAL